MSDSSQRKKIGIIIFAIFCGWHLFEFIALGGTQLASIGEELRGGSTEIEVEVDRFTRHTVSLKVLPRPGMRHDDLGHLAQNTRATHIKVIGPDGDIVADEVFLVFGRNWRHIHFRPDSLGTHRIEVKGFGRYRGSVRHGYRRVLLPLYSRLGPILDVIGECQSFSDSNF